MRLRFLLLFNDTLDFLNHVSRLDACTADVSQLVSLGLLGAPANDMSIRLLHIDLFGCGRCALTLVLKCNAIESIVRCREALEVWLLLQSWIGHTLKDAGLFGAWRNESLSDLRRLELVIHITDVPLLRQTRMTSFH